MIRVRVSGSSSKAVVVVSQPGQVKSVPGHGHLNLDLDLDPGLDLTPGFIKMVGPIPGP